MLVMSGMNSLVARKIMGVNMDTVFLLTEYCDGDFNVLGVYKQEETAIERARELAAYASLTEDEDSGKYFWYDDNGTSIEVKQWEII